MTIVLPTSAQLVARYPEFADVGSALIEAVIADAGGYVNDTWREGDQIPAILALVAHMLAMEGRGAGGGSAVSGAVTSVKVGDVSTTFAGRGGAMDMNGFGSTAYGERFLALRRRNFPIMFAV